MVLRLLSAMLATTLIGCPSASVQKPQADSAQTSEPTGKTFELTGSWNYSGGMQGLTNKLLFSNDLLRDSGDYKGTGWTILFDVESFDNDKDQARLKVTKIDGFSHYKLGSQLYLAWRFADDRLILYLSPTDYPKPVGGQEGKERATYTRQ